MKKYATWTISDVFDFQLKKTKVKKTYLSDTENLKLLVFRLSRSGCFFFNFAIYLLTIGMSLTANMHSYVQNCQTCFGSYLDVPSNMTLVVRAWKVSKRRSRFLHVAVNARFHITPNMLLIFLCCKGFEGKPAKIILGRSWNYNLAKVDWGFHGAWCWFVLVWF